MANTEFKIQQTFGLYAKIKHEDGREEFQKIYGLCFSINPSNPVYLDINPIYYSDIKSANASIPLFNDGIEDITYCDKEGNYVDNDDFSKHFTDLPF